MLRRTLIALFCFLLPALAHAEQDAKDEKGILSLVIENDSFANTDSYYTSGVRLAWLSPENQTPHWANWAAEHLPLAPEGNKRISLAAGQSIFTPSNINTSAPLYGDRPYAGWLYGSLGMVSDTGHSLDNVMLTLGIVGQHAYGEQTQKFIHHVISSPQPQGWDHQLQDEPGIMLTYEKKWRSLYTLSAYNLQTDFTPQIGTNLGNVYTDALAGAMIRLGFNLPADYGPPRIRPSLPGSDFFIPSENLAGYLFAGVEGRAVAHNIFLDGNTLSNSLHVVKEPFVGSAQLGAALTYGNARLSYTEVFLTKEFVQQKQSETFGVLTLSYRF